MTIAKEVKAKKQHQEPKASPIREQTKQQVQQICYALLDKYKGMGITGHSMFLYELNKNGIAIERMKNKQGKVYGLKFSYTGQSFKASEIGREFGYRSLQKNFEAGNKNQVPIGESRSKRLPRPNRRGTRTASPAKSAPDRKAHV